jgi:hypothetical protein
MMGSIQRELDEVFAELFGRRVADREVTDGGFSRARRKLSHTVFVALARETVDMAYRTMDCIERVAGYRILAVDGSKLNLPDTPEIRAHFDPKGLGPGEDGVPQALLSQCYDVVNGLVLDATVSPGGSCERRAALAHLEHVGEDDILLLDRGYPAHWFLQAVESTGARFVARVSTSFSKAVTDFVASGAETTVLDLDQTNASRTACAEFGIDDAPLRVRAVLIELPSGESEALLTNFIDEDFPADLFSQLYQMRWGVEEGYKRLKSPLEIENFSGLAVECVLQDIHARVFLANMTVITMLPVSKDVEERTADRELDYDINWTTAISKVRKAGVLLFLGHDIERVIDELQEATAKCLSPVRPGRSNPRKKGRGKKRFARNRKRT